MARKIKNAVFMGNIDCMHKKSEAHARLEEGFVHLSGLQQLATSPCVFPPSDADEINDVIADIMDVIADLAVSLGCRVKHYDDEMKFVVEITQEKELGNESGH